jgi:putative transposase
VSKETTSRITDRVLEEMQGWATRPLDDVCAAIFIDAIVVSPPNAGVESKLADRDV